MERAIDIFDRHDQMWMDLVNFLENNGRLKHFFDTETDAEVSPKQRKILALWLARNGHDSLDRVRPIDFSGNFVGVFDTARSFALELYTERHNIPADIKIHLDGNSIAKELADSGAFYFIQLDPVRNKVAVFTDKSPREVSGLDPK